VVSQEKAVRLRPDDAGGRYALALILQEAGRGAEATTALEEAIRRSPAFPEAHNALGIALAAQARVPEALREFERAAALDPHDARAQNNRGNALRDLSRLDEAEAAYRQAVALDGTYPDPHTGLGAVALARNDARAALEEFDRALALAPGQHELLVNRGIALELLGRAGEARQAYLSFLTAAGNTPAYAPAKAATRQLLARLDGKEGR
jgi:Flp pilus assembly protein TadD